MDTTKAENRGRPYLRRFSQIIAFFSLTMLGAALFQNCGTYQAESNPLFDQTGGSVCVGPSCSTDISAVQLRVGNQEPLLVISGSGAYDGCDASRCIDVAGFCDTAGYPGNNIYTEIKGPTPQGLTRESAKCDGTGRFRLRVQLPGGYQASSLHTLVVLLTVIDENGQEHTNPSGLNRHELSVIASQ